jgi:hypothetical protein
MPAIGQMDVVITGDTGPLMAGLSRMERQLQRSEGVATRHAAAVAASFQRIGRAISAAQTIFVGWVAAVGASRLVHWFNAASEEVDKLGKAAKRLGVSSEELSGLRFAAKESGVEFEKLATMAGKASRVVAEMVDKGQLVEQVGAFAVQLTDANGQVKNFSELLPAIARGIESAGSSAEQLRLAEKFFGRGGGDQFVTWLKESEGFVRGLTIQIERARRLGVIFTEDQVAKLTAYNDAVGRIEEALLGLRVNVLTRIAPDLEKAANAVAGAIAAVPEVVERGVQVAVQVLSEGKGPLVDQLNVVLQDMGKLVKATAELAVRGAYGIVVDMLRASWPMLRSEFQQGFNIAILDTLSATLETAAGAMATVFPRLTMSIYTALKPFNDGINAAKRGFEALRDADPFADLTESKFLEQWNVGVGRVSLRLGQLVSNADRLLDVSGALSRHAMTGFDRIADAAGGAAEKVAVLDERMAELAKNGTQAITGFAGSAGDALADFAIDGKMNLEDLAKSWSKTLLSMAAQALVFKPLFTSLGAGFGNLFSQSPGADVQGAVAEASVGFARGGVLEARPPVHKAARGMVLNQRTHFPAMRAVAAEAGHPEWAFAPLRKIGGDLGVKSTPANVSVQVIDQRGSGSRPEVTSHQGPDGRQTVRVLIRDEMKRALSDGSVDRTMADSFGLRRRAAGR